MRGEDLPSSSKLADGRYNLDAGGAERVSSSALGKNRDRIYRQAEVEWCPVEPAMNIDAEAMEGLRQLLFEYLR